MTLQDIFSKLKGGSGSGHWAHEGRPGKVGGSGAGGGLGRIGVKPGSSVEDRKAASQKYRSSDKPKKEKVKPESRNFVDAEGLEDSIRSHYDLEEKCGKSIPHSACDSVTTYTTSTYNDINGSLRSDDYGFSDPEEIDEYVNSMDDFFKKAPRVPADLTVYRGFSQKRVDSLNVGDEFVDKAFVSTSTSKEVTETFGAAIEIRVPKGSRGTFIKDISRNRSENELLLPRNSKFKVVEKKGNRTIVELVE